MATENFGFSANERSRISAERKTVLLALQRLRADLAGRRIGQAQLLSVAEIDELWTALQCPQAPTAAPDQFENKASPVQSRIQRSGIRSTPQQRARTSWNALAQACGK